MVPASPPGRFALAVGAGSAAETLPSVVRLADAHRRGTFAVLMKPGTPAVDVAAYATSQPERSRDVD